MGTPIFDRLIAHESAWTNASIGGREGLELRLPRGFQKGVDALLDRNRYKPLDAITRADFEEEVVSEVMAEVRRTVLEGRGAAVLSGLDISNYSVQDLHNYTE